MNPTIEKLRTQLSDSSDKLIQQKTQYYFKEDVKSYGIKSSDVQRISKNIFKEIEKQSKEEIFEYCSVLWESGYMEECIIACNWAESQHKKYVESDFDLFEHWLQNHITNWATCDTFCNHTVGDFIMKYPSFIERLKCWALSPNRWERRAAAVSLIVPARKGNFLNEIFEIATLLLQDNDDMVQKGYGWMLKSASQAHQQEVFQFVVNNKTRMPRTALRYSIEKMTPEMRILAMKK